MSRYFVEARPCEILAIKMSRRSETYVLDVGVNRVCRRARVLDFRKTVDDYYCLISER